MNTVVIEQEMGLARSGEMLVIGYGNVMRGDDGVGPAVAEAVEALGLRGVRVEAHHQLTPELAVALAGVKLVVFVDAVDSDEARSEAEEVCVREVALTSGAAVGWSGHRFDPEALLGLALAMEGRSPRAWSVEVPVQEFGWGPGLTAEAKQRVAAAVGAIRTLWEAEVCMRRA